MAYSLDYNFFLHLKNVLLYTFFSCFFLMIYFMVLTGSLSLRVTHYVFLCAFIKNQTLHVFMCFHQDSYNTCFLCIFIKNNTLHVLCVFIKNYTLHVFMCFHQKSNITQFYVFTMCFHQESHILCFHQYTFLCVFIKNHTLYVLLLF